MTGERLISAILLAVLMLVAGQAAAQGTKPGDAGHMYQRSEETALEVARLAAEATKEAARTSASAAESVGKATQSQIKESGERQFNATVATAIGVFFGALVALYGAWLNKRRLDEDLKENERKRLESRFNDIQNRLTSINDQERTNAVHALADIARQVDPKFLPRPRFNWWWLPTQMRLPHGFTPLLKNGSLRPCTAAFPFFEAAARRLGAILVLESHQTVRSAAVRAAKALAQFATDEFEGIESISGIDKRPPRSLIPMTKFLIEELATANREAYAQWVVSWAQFVAAATEIGGGQTGTDADPDDEDFFNFPGRQERKDGETRRQFENRAFTARQTRLMAQMDREYPGNGPLDWEPNYRLWETALSLCPFLEGNAIEGRERERTVTNYLLHAADEPAFQQQWWAHQQLVRAQKSSDDFKAQEQVEFRRRLELNAARFISSRDAIAGTLRSLRIHDAELKKLRGLIGGDDVRLVEYVGLDLMGTQLIGADLTGAQLFAADLSEASLPAARLCGADFRFARLDRAWLPDAQLDELARTWMTEAETTFDECQPCSSPAVSPPASDASDSLE